MCVGAQYSKSYLLKTTKDPVPRWPSLACLPLPGSCVRGPEHVHLRHLRRLLLQPQVPGGAPGDPVTQVDSLSPQPLFEVNEILKFYNLHKNFSRISAGQPDMEDSHTVFFIQTTLLCKDKIRGWCPSIRWRAAVHIWGMGMAAADR